MKLNSVVIAVLILGAAGLGMRSQTTTPATAAATRVAIVALQDAMLGTQDGQRAAAQMRDDFGPKQAKLEKLQADIQGLQDQLRKGAATLSAEARNRIETAIAEKNKNLTRDGEDLNAEMQQENAKISQTLTGKMDGVIDQYAKKNGYEVVLDVSNPQTPVLWAASAANITAEIVKIYDQAHPAPAAAKKP